MSTEREKPSITQPTPRQRAIMAAYLKQWEAEGRIVRVPGTGDNPLTCVWEVVGPTPRPQTTCADGR